MSAAAAKRTRPESVTPQIRFESHAVTAHAAIPENKANHPFVKGQGPFSISSIAPPPAARSVHAQAAPDPSHVIHLPRFSTESRSTICFISVASLMHLTTQTERPTRRNVKRELALLLNPPRRLAP